MEKFVTDVMLFIKLSVSGKEKLKELQALYNKMELSNRDYR